MNKPNIAPINRTNNERKDISSVSMNLCLIAAGIITKRKTSEKILIVNAMLNRNSMNFESISYCEGII